MPSPPIARPHPPTAGPPRRRPPAPPFAALAVAALAGGLWLHGDRLWGLLTLAATAVGVTATCRPPRHLPLAVAALAVLATAGWHGAARPPAPPEPAALDAPALRGRVIDDPRPGATGPRLTVELEARRQGTAWHPTAGRVRLAVRGTPSPPPARGDVAVFAAPLRPPRGFRNPGGEGYAAFLRREGIAARAGAGWPGGVWFARPAPGEAPLLSWRRRAGEAISAAAPGAGGAVLRALALGDRSALAPDTMEAFRRTGTSHVLAISGLHLGILGLLLIPALRRGLGRVPGLALRWPAAAVAPLLAIPLLVAYAALSGFQTSTLRALAMAALLLAGTALSRPVSRAGLLAATALSLALWHPPVLAEPGFQLSLAALAGLFWLAPAALSRLPEARPDPLQRLLREAGAEPPARRAVRAAAGVGRALLRWTAYSTAAAATTTPLAVFHFGAGTPAGAVLSPGVIAALGFLCLPATLLGLLLQPLAPGAAAALWGAAGGVAGAVAGGLGELSPHAPLVAWQALRTPEGVLGAAALLAAATAALRPAGGRRGALGLALLGAALVAVPAAARHALEDRDPALHLWALDVGQGQAVALRAPGGHWALVDGGGFPASRFDVGARVVVPTLEHLGATGLDLVVSTHPHPDHLKGLVSALRWGRPEQLWLPGSFAGDPRYGPLLDAAREAGSRVVWVAAAGRRGALGGVPLESRWVPAAGENDRSQVLRVGPPGHQVLIAADLEVEGQRRLLASGFDPACQVLVAPHHGAASSLWPPFLRATGAAAVIISAAGRGGLPAPGFVAAAGDTADAVWSTHRVGCVHARIAADAPAVTGPARVDTPWAIW